MGVWVKELGIHSRCLDGSSVYRIEGSREKKLKILERQSSRQGVYIINYESLRALRKTKSLAGLYWDTVIADESTRIKTPRSLQSLAMHEFADKNCANRIMLTGMPVTQCPLEYWSQFRFLNPSVFGTRYFSFRAHYAEMRERQIPGKKAFREIVGYKNLDDLKAKVAPHAIRFEKDDCLDLPPKIYQTVEVPFHKKQKKLYVDLCKEMIAEIDGQKISVANALAKMMKLRQICNGWVVDEFGATREIVSAAANPKLSALRNLVDELGKGFVVWCQFRKDIQMVRNLLEELGLAVGVITGDTLQANRDLAIDRFQDGALDAMVLMSATCEFGVTLTRGHASIYFGNGHSVDKRVQSEDRMHRAGLNHKVTYIDLVIGNSVDSAMAKVLNEKIEMARSLSDIRNLIA
jgi:SNF2 family DNA or RNA helicase